MGIGNSSQGAKNLSYILDFLNVKLRKCIYEDVCMYDEVSLEHVYNAQLQMKKLLDCFVV